MKQNIPTELLAFPVLQIVGGNGLADPKPDFSHILKYFLWEPKRGPMKCWVPDDWYNVSPIQNGFVRVHVVFEAIETESFFRLTGFDLHCVLTASGRNDYSVLTIPNQKIVDFNISKLTISDLDIPTFPNQTFDLQISNQIIF